MVQQMSDKPPNGTVRLILRSSGDGRAMVGGVIFTDLCNDNHERVVQGTIDLDNFRSFRIENPKVLEGQRMDQMMTGGILGSDFPNEYWPEEKKTVRSQLEDGGVAVCISCFHTWNAEFGRNADMCPKCGAGQL
jgi:hypothetical protein